jgi:hypothetical protein
MAMAYPQVGVSVFINGKPLDKIISVSDVGQDYYTSFARIEIEDDVFNIVRLRNSGELFSCRIDYKDSSIEATGFRVSDYSNELTPDAKCTFRIVSGMAWSVTE